MKNLGFDVRIKYKAASPFGATEDVRHNVTEIHYHYRGIAGKGDSVAFESDIHATGGTIQSEYIDEFEATLAERIHEHY